MKKIIFLLIFVCMLCGCSSNTAQVVPDSLVIALSSEPETGFDPIIGWGRYGSPLIQSTLLKTDENMNITNDLAESYSISDDGLTWSFYIKDDVKFSNGNPLTAFDVEFTFNEAKQSGSVVDLVNLDFAKAVSDYEVEFKLHEPQSTFIYIITQTGIVPHEIYDENYANTPIGSGPFTMLEWSKGEQVILGINEYYYDKKPAFERVILVFMDDDSAYAAAKNGSVDIATTNTSIANNAIEGMSLYAYDTVDNRGITMPMTKDTGDVNSFGHPIGNDVTSNLAIREALNIGINREDLVTFALNGYGEIAFSDADGMPWGSNRTPIYNRELAIEILEQDGFFLADDGFRYKNGIKAEFTLLYNAGDEVRQALSLAVSEEARKLGINILVEGSSWDEIDKKMHSNAVMMGWGAQNPIEMYLLYHSSNALVDYYNPQNFINEHTDMYLEQALRENDLDKSNQYFALARESIEMELPYIWLVNIDHLYYVSDDLNMGEIKIQPHDHAWPILWNLNEWERRAE